jgi:hypothetical protein
VQQTLSMVRADDVMLVLAENPAATVRLIQRRLEQVPPINSNSIGTARAS